MSLDPSVTNSDVTNSNDSVNDAIVEQQQQQQEPTNLIYLPPRLPAKRKGREPLTKRLTELVQPQVDLDSLEVPLEEKLEIAAKEGSTTNSSLIRAYVNLQYNHSDLGNGEMFVKAYEGKIHYNHSSKKWIYWSNSQGWVVDDRDFVIQLAQLAIRKRAEIANKLPVNNEDEKAKKLKQNEKQWCLKSEQISRVRAMLECAKSSPIVATTENDWDNHKHLLGVKNGIINLNTSELIKPQDTKHLRMIKKCNASYLFEGLDADDIERETTKAEIWTQFLSNIFTVDNQPQPELQEYILTSLGYSLTGFTDDKSVFCLYGEGDNGKSMLLSILRQIMSSYADIMPFSAIEMNNRNQLSNDIAALKGKRFIAASETQEGVRLNEGRIKSISGDEDARGRFLYQENVTFRPELKLWLAFNHKPLVTDETSSFWDRLKLIELVNCFRKGDPRRIPRLEYRLLDEKDIILSILIQYARKYLAEGLNSPQSIRFNVDEYRKESNPVNDFINDCCEIGTGDDYQVETVVLYRAYIAWCKEFSKRAMGRNNFYNKMYAAGFEKHKTTVMRNNYFLGIKLEDKVGNLRYFENTTWD